MSKPLPQQKVFTAVENKLKGKLKFLAFKWLFSSMPRRHCSKLYAKRHPEAKVDTDQIKLMALLKQHGLSFMEIEEVMRLSPASGMEAYRCIKKA